MTIKDLIKKYEADRVHYLTPAYNETLLRSDFLDPLFELLGWDIKNSAGRPTNEREVILEEGLKASVSEHTKKPDYTFRLFAERKLFLEAKKPSVAIESNNESAKQVRRYGFTAKLKISVVSNFEYLLIYDTSIQVEPGDLYNKALIKKYHYTEYEEKFDEIKKLLGKESVYSGEFDKEWEHIEEKITQFSIDDLFLKQINEWRKLLGAEIYKHSPKITEDALNDAVQSYLNRVLFLRVCEDRNLEVYQTLLAFANANDFDALIKKFQDADKRYNSGLFDQLLTDKVIKDVSSVFWNIIKQLYYPESSYSFAVFSSDVLGRIYEIFLSEKLVINKGTIELVKKPENVDRDIVTTPTFIINHILRVTVLPKCDNKSLDEILKLKFADIACGSGAFLLELFQLVNDSVIDYYIKNDPSKLIRVNLSTYKLPFEAKRDLLLKCVYGVDKDYNAVEASKFGLLLKLLEGEDTASTKASSPVLPPLDANIFYGNSLIEPSMVSDPTHVLIINPFDFGNLVFDAIVGNPPYMMSEDMKTLTPLELPIYKREYAAAYRQFDKYFLFIERSQYLIKTDGLVGFIVPSKFTKVGAGKVLRENLRDDERLHTIMSFGANQVFSDKTTYTCLLILTGTPQDTFEFGEVRSLNSWKLRKPDAVKFDTKKTADLDSEVWVLVPPNLIPAHKKILAQSSRLADIVDEENIFNGIQTSANDVLIFTPEDVNDPNYYHFTKKRVKYKIEKSFTRSYYKTNRGQDNLNTYREFKPNALVIYPYTNTPSGVQLIPLPTIQKNFPFAYKYLNDHKAILNKSSRDIQPRPTTPDEWHRFGRVQGLTISPKKEKIFLGVLSNGDKYAIDKYGTLFTSGGTAGYCAITLPDDCDYSIYYIQAILNSKYAELFVILTGEVFRGGYFARGTKVLDNLPIRTIDFDDPKEKAIHDKIVDIQKDLITAQGEIDKYQADKRKLVVAERTFHRLKVKMDQELANLYDLGTDDAQIPLIKELYEAD